MEIGAKVGRSEVGVRLRDKGSEREVDLAVLVGERWPETESTGGAHSDIGIRDARVV